MTELALPSALKDALQDLRYGSSVVAWDAERSRPQDLQPEALSPASDLVLGPIPHSTAPGPAAEAIREVFRTELGKETGICLWFDAGIDDESLAAWRNALWPWLHAGAVVRGGPEGVEREILQGKQGLGGKLDAAATLFCLRPREHVMSPDATVLKFDANAKGWNGNPGSPGYPHYRWMRRFIAVFPDNVPRKRILDFGSGAGWVGIEAALRSPGAHLALFDPSPEMVRHAEDNARQAGLSDVVGRTGFGEEPPFPGPGEDPYDLVLSSGVISFSPDFERWYDGLARAVAPGGTLVIGDINREAKGFVNRRGKKPLLPARELNARAPHEIRAALEERGFRYQRGCGYQLTWPIPQAMHISEQKLHGLLSPPLLALNRLAASRAKRRNDLSGSFDSWVLEFDRP